MPKGHRAGRKNQIRRLALRYRLEAVESLNLLGTTSTPWVREVQPIKPKEQGYVVAPGDWVLPKLNPVEQTDAALKEPVVWKPIPIDQ